MTEPGVGEDCRLAVLSDVSSLVAMAHAHSAVIADQRGGESFLVDEAAAQAERAASGGADWIRERIADPESFVVTGTYDGVALGYGVASRVVLADGIAQAKVQTLLVDPDAREVGIGEAMMNAIVDWARASDCHGIDAFALPGDRFTKNFFESFGLKARLLTVTIDLTA